MRYAGILLPISSLPSPYGIGTFSKSARQVVDQLEAAGQHYWQILPLGPTGYGDSLKMFRFRMETEGWKSEAGFLHISCTCISFHAFFISP